MKELNETVTERRRLTRNSIYRYIYETDAPSTASCISALALSAPTVYQNLAELIEAELVRYGEEQPSTGGRRAHTLEVVPDARLAIGVSVTDDRLYIAATDLCLNELAARSVAHTPTADMAELGRIIAAELEPFIDQSGVDREKLLGVGISIPAVIDRARNRVTLSPALHLRDTSLDQLTSQIPYTTFVENDGNCGGYAEWFALKGQRNMAYITLEDGVGGAVLVNGNPYSGDNLRSGEFGHMCVQPNGADCICGKNGCLEAYCSVRRISDDLGLTCERFFELINSGDTRCAAIWSDLLGKLAVGVNNIRMALDCDVVLGGYMAQFMEPYLPQLREYVSQMNTFDDGEEWLRLSRYLRRATVLGAALHFIGGFIESI